MLMDQWQTENNTIKNEEIRSVNQMLKDKRHYKQEKSLEVDEIKQKIKERILNNKK